MVCPLFLSSPQAGGRIRALGHQQSGGQAAEPQEPPSFDEEGACQNLPRVPFCDTRPVREVLDAAARLHGQKVACQDLMSSHITMVSHLCANHSYVSPCPAFLISVDFWLPSGSALL